MNSIYLEKGYRDRDHYLECLAEEYGVTYLTVSAFTYMYGSDEDFDGLVTAIQDLVDEGY